MGTISPGKNIFVKKIFSWKTPTYNYINMIKLTKFIPRRTRAQTSPMTLTKFIIQKNAYPDLSDKTNNSFGMKLTKFISRSTRTQIFWLQRLLWTSSLEVGNSNYDWYITYPPPLVNLSEIVHYKTYIKFHDILVYSMQKRLHETKEKVLQFA